MKYPAILFIFREKKTFLNKLSHGKEVLTPYTVSQTSERGFPHRKNFIGSILCLSLIKVCFKGIVMSFHH